MKIFTFLKIFSFRVIGRQKHLDRVLLIVLLSTFKFIVLPFRGVSWKFNYFSLSYWS